MAVSTGARRWLADARAPLSEGVTYVRALPERWTTLLVGGLLWGYGVWLGPLAVVVMGFFIQILKHVPPVAGEPDVTPVPPEPPRFHRWTTLVFDGVRAYVVWMGYLLFAFAGAISAAGEENAEELFVAVFGALLGNVAFILNVRKAVGASAFEEASVGLDALYSPATLLVVVAMYVAPAALLNVAARGRLSDGFDFGAIRPILWSPSYLRRWVLFMTTWLAATAVLYLPVGALLATWFPGLDGGVHVFLRESVELLRGFLSFGLLVLGYAVLGRVGVPPTDRLSIERVRAFVYGSRLKTLARSGRQFGRTVLVVAILASFWSVPAAVLLFGYLSRFVRAVDDGRPPPTFEDLPGLVADGVRGVGVWLVYAAVPVGALAVWYAITPVYWKPWLQVAVAGLTGGLFGTFYLGRDLYFWVQPPYGFTETGELAVLSVVALTTPLALYLLPVAFVLVARERRFRAALSPRRVLAVATRGVYAKAWLRGMAVLAAGFGATLWWNNWDAAAGLDHTVPLVQFGLVTVIEVPSAHGLLSSTLLLVTSGLAVLLVFRAWEGFVRAAVAESDRTEVDGDLRP